MTTPLTQTTGRRKRSVARARLRPGTGNITINGKTFAEYFPTDAQRMVVSEPLRDDAGKVRRSALREARPPG